MTNKQKDYLTTREAAALLNVAVSTIQLWTNDGLLEAWTTVGGHRRIRKSSVENMLSNKKAGSILIVEDNEMERASYEQHFKQWGMSNNISICKDGYAGLIHVGQLAPEIIITDLMMQDINSFEMITAIKQNVELENTLIIVVSTLTSAEIRTRGGLPPDVLVLNKSVLFEELEDLVRKKMKAA